jgi:hypothetical protein
MVAWVVYKLAHDANFCVCSELFAIGKSITSFVFFKFVITMNDIFKKYIFVNNVFQSKILCMFNVCCNPSIVYTLEFITSLHVP